MNSKYTFVLNLERFYTSGKTKWHIVYTLGNIQTADKFPKCQKDRNKNQLNVIITLRIMSHTSYTILPKSVK